MTAARIVLSPAQRAEIARGRFVRVDLGEKVTVGDVTTRTAVLGKLAPLAHSDREAANDTLWRAYANVCRHHAIPLDLGFDSPMTHDGRYLLCHQHGAMYRPADGVCFLGPCVGAALVTMRVEEDGDALVIHA